MEVLNILTLHIPLYATYLKLHISTYCFLEIKKFSVINEGYETPK
jgi:hypothetical protein